MIEAGASEVRLSSAEQRFLALLEAAQCWLYEQGLVLGGLNTSSTRPASFSTCTGVRHAEKLPESLRAPYELMVWARPVREEDDVTGLEQYAHWFAHWLNLCLPVDESCRTRYGVRS
jgi:hypothetical protein